jgi:hypothetical protein
MPEEGKVGKAKRPTDLRVTKIETDENQDSETSEAKLDAGSQAIIGAQLKLMYNKICTEPVPTQILELLRKLERKEHDR